MGYLDKTRLADLVNRLLDDFGFIPEVRKVGDKYVVNYLNTEYAKACTDLHSLLANFYNTLADERDARKAQALAEVKAQPDDEALAAGGVK
jgi:hypothetical protein